MSTLNFSSALFGTDSHWSLYSYNVPRGKNLTEFFNIIKVYTALYRVGRTEPRPTAGLRSRILIKKGVRPGFSSLSSGADLNDGPLNYGEFTVKEQGVGIRQFIVVRNGKGHGASGYVAGVVGEGIVGQCPDLLIRD